MIFDPAYLVMNSWKESTGTMSTSENKKEIKVFQILVDNNSGVLSRIAGLFSRRGYNIESITAGVTADPNITRITIMTSGDDDIKHHID